MIEVAASIFVAYCIFMAITTGIMMISALVQWLVEHPYILLAIVGISIWIYLT